MKNKLFFGIVWSVGAFIMFSFSIKPGANAILTIHFENYVDDKLLQFDTAHYTNSLGQDFVVTKFKYYISNIRLIKSDRNAVAVDEYYLVNEEDEVSKKIKLEHLPQGVYTGIRFMIGVDSLHNCSGAQAGALDPANAMFWAWNSGYIFLKLEGKSPASASPGHLFEFHIGGYKSPVNCIREVSLKFKAPLELNKAGEVHIKADVAEILKSPTIIDFSKLSSVTDAHNAKTIADNYADMFSVLSGQ